MKILVTGASGLIESALIKHLTHVQGCSVIDLVRSIKVINSLKAFKEISDIVVANRNARNLKDIQHKVFTRDIYGVN